ncbi:MAG: Glucose-1-phosphate thymidylyltransferase [Myxococcota bacterium]|nr:Glucose-1-phosphate thymidylyltransferase [Myxococcota bacterium]
MKGVKGIVLAGGTGSRLFPLTKVTNKHLLPVGQKPMIFYPIEALTRAGIDEILIVTGTEHMGDVVGLLGSGREYGCRFTYKVQDEAGGIAQALGLAEVFVGNDRCVVILGDNIFQDDIGPYVEEYMKQPEGAAILLKEVKDPHRFGVAEVSGGRVLSIEEKPKQPKSSLAVIGVYMYDARVFGVIRELRPSARGELEITDVNNAYLKEGRLTSSVLRGYWTDAGTFDSLRQANELVTANPPGGKPSHV